MAKDFSTNSLAMSRILVIFMSIVACFHCYSHRSRKCEPDEVYFPKARKCFRIGLRGPCKGEFAAVMAQISDPRLGECRCHPNQHYCSEFPTIFLEEYQECFELFQQGPCDDGEWLIPKGIDQAECEAVPCLDELRRFNRTLASFLFSYDGQCQRMSDEDFLDCDEDKVLSWRIDEEEGFQPFCGFKCAVAGGYALSVSGYLPCAHGSVRDSQTGGCNQLADFD